MGVKFRGAYIAVAAVVSADEIGVFSGLAINQLIL